MNIEPLIVLGVSLTLSHSSYFKKRFNCVKMVMVGCYVVKLTVQIIYMPDFAVINTSYIIKN